MKSMSARMAPYIRGAIVGNALGSSMFVIRTLIGSIVRNHQINFFAIFLGFVWVLGAMFITYDTIVAMVNASRQRKEENNE